MVSLLRSLLFAGLLINRDKLPSYLQWLETTSFFHAAFEAFLVNEVRYLQLRDHRCKSEGVSGMLYALMLTRPSQMESTLKCRRPLSSACSGSRLKYVVFQYH